MLRGLNILLDKALAASARGDFLSFCMPDLLWAASLFLAASCSSSTLVQAVDSGLEGAGTRINSVVLPSKVRPLGFYESSVLHVVADIDVDMDGVLDKVVSSAQGKGDDLFFFKNIGGDYHVVLVSKNLSEDGGRVFGGVFQEAGGDEVMSVETFFPKGLDEARHYISYADGRWVISRTVYTVSDWRVDEDHMYLCEVPQDIPMADLALEQGAVEVRQIPIESDRDELCMRQVRAGR